MNSNLNNKNLNTAYKQHIDDLITDRVPDLWNRIESALPEKNIERETIEDINKSAQKKSNIVKFNGRVLATFTSIAAACVAGIIIIPTIMNGTVKNAATEAFVATEEAACAEAPSEESYYEEESDDVMMEEEFDTSLSVMRDKTEAMEEAVAAEDNLEEMFGAAADEAVMGACAEDESNSVQNAMKNESSDMAAAEGNLNNDFQTNAESFNSKFYVVRQYDSAGNANFSSSGVLEKTVKELNDTGNIIFDYDDIFKLRSDVIKDETGFVEYVVEIRLTKKAALKWQQFTKDVSQTGESYAFYKNGNLISVSGIKDFVTNGVVRIYGFASHDETEKFIDELVNQEQK